MSEKSLLVMQAVATVALRQLAGDGSEGALRLLTDRFADQGQMLVRALQKSSEQAWRAVEIALAGESFWNKLDRADDKAFRQQIRQFLDAVDLPLLTGKGEFRRLCLQELRAARQKGLLSGQLVPEELSRRAGRFAPHADQAAILKVQRECQQELGDLLAREGFRNLAHLVTQDTGAGQNLLVTAITFYFRREVENNDRLARGLQFTRMENLTTAQESGFAALAQSLDQHGQRAESLLQDLTGKLDAVAENVEQVRLAALDVRAEQERQGGKLDEIYRFLQQLLEQSHLQQRREIRPGDSRSIRGDAERRRVRDLVDRYAALPEQERQSRPALLNAVGLLQVAAGDAEGAQRSFDTVVTLVSDPATQAQVRFNAYQAALERKDFASALVELREAIRLDAQRYAPFPTDRFTVERILGAGGFGVAFLCQHVMLRRPVVVKTLRLEDLDRDADDVFREAQALNDLDHAAIIKLRDCGFADPQRQRPYLVMDFFDGCSLGEYVVRHGLLTGEQLLPLARAVAEGLKAAHDQGVLHRDVKPDNILVRRESAGWKVKLIDFGLALRQEKAEDTLRSPGNHATPQGLDFAGTLDYAAPEQVGKLPGAAVGPHSDVYGFGRTCYFALLGVPDPGDDEKQTLPEDWRRFLGQCTARKLENRIRDFGQVLSRLAEIKTVSMPIRPTPAAAAPAQPTPAQTSPPSRPVPANPGVPPRYVPPAPASQPAQPKPLPDLWSQPANQGRGNNSPADPPRSTGKSVLGSAFGNPGNEEPAQEPPPPPPSPPPDPPKKKRGDGPLGGAFS